jgi:hypothetical protein
VCLSPANRPFVSKCKHLEQVSASVKQLGLALHLELPNLLAWATESLVQSGSGSDWGLQLKWEWGLVEGWV